MNYRPLMLGATALFVACGSGTTAPTEVNPAAWATGTWVAVRANGKPLPFQDSQNYPFVRYDSLIIVAYASPTIGASFAGVFPWQTLYFSASLSPSAIVCSDPGAALVVSATAFATVAKGAKTSIGDCATSFVNLTFSRKGDSLAGMWNGADVRLVRRQ